MNKKINLIFALMMALGFSGHAQIVINNLDMYGHREATYEFSVFETSLEQVAAADTSGENVVWDFANVREQSSFNYVYISPEELDGFPASVIARADFGLTTTGGMGGGNPLGFGGELPYFKEDNKLKVIVPIPGDLDGVFLVEQSERKALLWQKFQQAAQRGKTNDDEDFLGIFETTDIAFPAAFGDQWQDVVSLPIALPGEFLAAIAPDLPFSPDSIRISFEITVNSEVTGSGNLMLPRDEYEAVKVTRTINFDFGDVEFYLFGNWIPAPIDLGDFLGDDLDDLDFPVTSEWYSNEYGIAIMELTSFEDEDEVTVSYMKEQVSTSRAAFDKPQIKLYPNPTADVLHIENNFKTGFNIAVYDLTGKRIQNKPQQSGTTVQLEVSHLKSGMYILRMEDREGNQATKKFIVK